MIFEHSEETRMWIARVQRFMDEHIYPNDELYHRQEREGDRWKAVPIVDELKAKARAEGLWNLFMPPHSGHAPVDETFVFEGEQLTNLQYAAVAEIMHMAENGFCADGDQEKMIADGDTEIGGRLPINTDGGLIANGEPIGASGLRQIHEVVRQLRGQAGDRQVPGDPRVGYTQLYGAPGTAGVSILSL